MAKIYKGMDYQLQRPAAVKVLSQEEVDSDKTLTKRFQREARAVAALEHDNIITIYQYGEQDGVYFLAMQLIKGKDLAQELKRLKRAGQKMDIRRAMYIMEQVASALDFAHKAGVVHRDIKPSNILLDDDDKAILTDFGLVLRTSSETTLGTAFGTPRYIAPEQAISSNKAVAQSDIYALGVILYEVLTGETPFNGESPMEIALSHISDPPPRPRSKEKSIPEAVERELLKALEKEPEKRHRSALAFVQAVKKGYGLTTAEVPAAVSQPRPPAPPPAPTAAYTDSWDLPPAKTPRQKRARQKTAGAAAGRSIRKPVLLLLALVVLLGAVAALVMLGGSARLPLGAAPGAPVRLVYDELSFVMFNGGDYTLDVAADPIEDPRDTPHLKFVRGTDGDGDDFYGSRITQNIMPPGACARIVLPNYRGRLPAECASEHFYEQLMDSTRVWWRRELRDGSTVDEFTVWYKDRKIAVCETVPRGGSAECLFNWPVVPPAPTPPPEDS